MAKIQPRMQQSEERGDGLREKMIAVNRVHQGGEGRPGTRLRRAHRGRGRRRRHRHGKGKAREVPVAVQKAMEGGAAASFSR